MPALTPEAKQLLWTTIRGLRERLLRDIHSLASEHYEAFGRRRPQEEAERPDDFETVAGELGPKKGTSR